LIAIIGTTASGKSDVALKLARTFGGIIIAADARTLYKGLDIGTAKPTKPQQRQVPHFMLDQITVRTAYSAGKFQKKVYRLIEQHKDKPIFLVGGNGLYVDAVLKGLDFAKTGTNKKLRTRLGKKSLAALVKLLRHLDPAGAKKVDLQNKRRVIRALEVKMSTGNSLFTARKTSPPDFAILKIGLTKPRNELKTRISRRVESMFRAGWVAEVKKMLKKYPASAPGFSSHGYPEIINYLRGKMMLPQAKAKTTHNVWLYAKRQLNWFNKDKEIIWLDPAQYQKAKKLVKEFLAPRAR